MTPTPRSRLCFRSTLVVPILATTLALGGVACSSSDSTKNAVLDQVAPTKADIASQAGVTFPSSTKGFKLVRISADQIDVTFTVATTDVGTFASGSKLTLTAGERVIVHASPLWDVAVSDAVQGGQSVRNGVQRSAEVIAAGDTSTVRLSLLRQS